MGLILDSSILIAAERNGKNARQSLTDIASKVGDTEIGISVVTLIELSHGAARANTAARKKTRKKFIQDLMLGLPVYFVTATIALRVGEIDGENQNRGIVIPLADLLIGVTALELGHDVLTNNPRHFRMIPGLGVRQL